MTGTLNAKQEAFCTHYMVSFNASDAAREAGYSLRSAGAISHDLLKNPAIIARLAELKAAQAKRLTIDADDVMLMWWHTATADANELTQHRIGACRHCHGVDHQYQWRTLREFDVAKFRWQLGLKEGSQIHHDPTEPVIDGGFGYRSTSAPNPACPECDGLGVSVLVIADTTKLSPRARALYRGVKATQNGLEVLTADQGKALENVARRYGLLKEHVELDTGDRLTKMLVELTKRSSAAPLRGNRP